MGLKVEKNITLVFCAAIDIEIFTFLDHNEIVHTHDGIMFFYRKCGAKYLAECETGSECEIEQIAHCLLVGFPCLG